VCIRCSSSSPACLCLLTSKPFRQYVYSKSSPGSKRLSLTDTLQLKNKPNSSIRVYQRGGEVSEGGGANVLLFQQYSFKINKIHVQYMLFAKHNIFLNSFNLWCYTFTKHQIHKPAK
jgi:hypothetical protein